MLCAKCVGMCVLVIFSFRVNTLHCAKCVGGVLESSSQHDHLFGLLCNMMSGSGFNMIELGRS